MGTVKTADRPGDATAETWMFPPENGWTADQVSDLELPFAWELVDGVIAPRGMTVRWHNRVRDGLKDRLHQALDEPYAVVSEQCLLVDEHNPAEPDVTVFDKRNLNVFELGCIPVEKAALVVEVVSPGSRQDDRFRKPALFAGAGVPFFWRVERGEDDLPVVHELWLHHELGTYVPAPEHPRHTRRLVTELPFPVDIDLRELVGPAEPEV